MYVKEWGAEIDVYDLEISANRDLADEGIWTPIRDAITGGEYDGGMHAPPCGSFCANRGNDGGPRALLGPDPPDLYGFKFFEPTRRRRCG